MSTNIDSLYMYKKRLDNSKKSFIGVLVLIITSPYLLLLAIYTIISDAIKEPRRKREYYNSDFYKELQVPYRKSILSSDSYVFYDLAKRNHLEFTMIHVPGTILDCVEVNNTLYVFPMLQDEFWGITYHADREKWYASYDGDLYPLEDEWEKYLTALNGIRTDEPRYLLIKKNSIMQNTYEDEELNKEIHEFNFGSIPPYVHLVNQYLDILI